MITGGSANHLSAVEAKSRAHALAFGPFAFQASMSLRDLGILAALDKAGTTPRTEGALAEETGLSEYAVSVLLDFGAHLGLVAREDGGWLLDKVGHFMLHDEMTRVNCDFTRDVCYHALDYLDESLRKGEPAGLHTLGPWSTVYEGLAELAEPARTSWFRFDHLYSDRVFNDLLPLIFDRPVKQLMDVGGNTGRWARRCLEHDPEVTVTLVDLPGQLEKAQERLAEAGHTERVGFHAADMLDDSQPLPEGADVIWMSQFLDCFSADQIVGILRRARAAMGAQTRLFIVELFPDRQAFEAAAYSLDATSLYFTCVANGNSRMYPERQFTALLAGAGLVVEQSWDNVGVGHTALCCRLDHTNTDS